jgi:hypothetical protein
VSVGSFRSTQRYSLPENRGFGRGVCKGGAGYTEFGEEEGEDEPDGASSDDEHRQMRRVPSSSAASKGREGRVLPAPVPRDSAAVQGEEPPAPATGDRRHRPDELGLGGGGDRICFDFTQLRLHQVQFTFINYISNIFNFSNSVL